MQVKEGSEEREAGDAGRGGVWQLVRIISGEVLIGTGFSLSKEWEWGNSRSHA
jgi:hypothetical protein